MVADRFSTIDLILFNFTDSKVLISIFYFGF
jgi:hypothetical protein